ncbi:MAG TPA: glycosyltransferase family 39 protein [Candidatus Dormibacteraeota bacterium]|nr:glycosyltransferase family 39 protein [Candidatus Dormibacteraeota bacterium]
MRARVPWPWVAVAAAIKLAITVPFLGRYGWHGDELYFVAASRHLAFGYVDFPPLVPLLAAAIQAVAPGSLVAMRLLPDLVGVVLIVLTALIARELGATTRAQAFAALGLTLSPIFVGSNALFHTATFDQLAWAVSLLLFVRLLRIGDARLWVALGLAIGIGLETKHTMVALPVALLLGLLVTRQRAMLVSPWPCVGAAVALLVFLPNLVWQASHDWISVQYVLSHRGHTDGPFAYWWQQVLVFFNPIFVVPAVLGMARLYRDPRFRPAVYSAIAVELIFFGMGGKSYYAAPVYPLLYAAGAMWLDSALTSRIRVAAFMTPAVAVGLVLAAAVLPIAAKPSGLFLDEVGWPELAQQAADAYDSVPSDQRAHTMVLAHYYQEAAAIDFYGPALGLPQASSPHLSYWYWAPPRMDPTTVVLINFTLDEGNRLFTDCRQVATVTNSQGIVTNDYGAPILICTNPRRPLWQAWQSLQTLD